MMTLEIKNLYVAVEGKEILKGITLTLEEGKVQALMGPNGSGKSTLAQALMGHPKYEVTQGKILLNGEDITEAAPDERARKGLFLSFQYPKEIAGVSLSNFLRAAYNALREKRQEKKLSVVEFYRLLQEKMKVLQVDPAFGSRSVNEGFSGGEKKKAEILQLLVLEPRFAILDETDSGLDVDSLRIVAEGINTIKGPQRGILLITHYHRILDYVTPDVVHVMKEGQIVKTGGKELARQIETEGFENMKKIKEEVTL
ncbi:MAG TPA: Fe-S cluster assembly ATPase SufC [Candidatus Nanoarchaeia archaeon]|nr:Fe-S cluster assembly ATPase SufC [Candidatus Nanoarchaeia archaeon]